MRRYGWLLCIVLVGLCAGITVSQSPVRRHLVLISIDGLTPEYYLHPEQFGLKLPNIEKLRDSGSWADSVVGQYPSLTYPSHTSMLTGVAPARHGIIANTIFDPLNGSRDWYLRSSAIRVPILWDVARQAGLKVGAVFWPVTVGSAIDYLIPEAFPAPPGMTTRGFMRSVSTPGLFDAVSAGVPDEIIERPTDYVERDRFAASAAAFIIQTYQPDLMLVHLTQTDGALHDYGPRTAEVFRAYAMADDNIGKIIQAVRAAGLDAMSAFVITGDHGFYAVHSTLQPNVVLRQAGLLKTGAADRVVEWKAAAHGGAIRIADPRDKTTEQQALRLFTALTQGSARNIFRIVTRSELDKLGAYPPAAFMIEPAEGYMLSDGFENDAFIVPSRMRGNHGYLPDLPAMHTGLILSGSGVRKGIHLAKIPQIDIAPTVALLLGLRLANIDGVPLTQALAR